MKKLARYFKNKWVIAALVILFLSAIIWARAAKKPEVQLVKATRGTIISEVSVTGSIEPAEDISLSFEKSGKVSRVYHDVGDRVGQGELIATLASADISAQLASAKASLAAAQAKFDELNKGTRPEELAIKQTSLDQAKLSLQNDYVGVLSTLQNAYINADDAVRKQTDAFFINDDQLNPTLTFSTYNYQAQNDAENGRGAMTRMLAAWSTELNRLSTQSAPQDFDAALSNATTHVADVQRFLENVQSAFLGAQGLTSGTVTAYQTSLTTARTETTTSQTSITSASQLLATQKLAVRQAENDLALAKAGSTPEAIRAEQAEVDGAIASVNQIQAELAKTIIRAPIAGVVTKQDAKIGEIVTANSSIAAMISDARYQIEANIPETDIGAIAVGETVRITLDAFQDETFEGQVTRVDPAETIVDGAVNFKVKVVFTKQDPRLRSGLTANLAIQTGTKNNAIILPQYAILQNDDGIFVEKNQNGKTVRIPVKTGIQDRDGRVEILSGVDEGEEVANIGTK